MIGFDTAVLPCSGEACDNTRWVIMTLAGSDDLEHARQQVAIFLPGACGIERVQLPDLSPLNGGDTQVRLAAWSVRPAGSLELAITDTSGNLAIVGLNGPETAQTKSLGAVGVAWSNAGDRLAVVTRDRSQPAEKAHQLLILSPQLEELDRFVLDLPLSDRSRDLIHDRFVVSWNADDTQVAVSTTVACVLEAGSPCWNLRAEPVCMVVNLADRQTHRLRLFDAYFVGSDELVTTIPPPGDGPFAPPLLQGRVARVRLSGGKITQMQPLIGPQFVLGSDAPEGVFLAFSPVVATPNSAVPAVSLRSADGTRQTVIGTFALSVHPDPNQAGELRPVLIPADVALPALQAAALATECP